MIISPKVLAAALISAAAPWLVAPAAAGPMAQTLGLQNAVAPSTETVRWRGHRYGGYRGYGRAAAGIAAGAIIGGAIIGATRPYGYYGYGGYAPGYYGPGYYGPGYYDQGYVTVAPYAGGNAVAYCRQRFRSYDPASGTYLGYDGLRHPCP